MKEQEEQISLSAIFHRIVEKKWTYVKVMAAAFVLSCIFILPVPRYYSCNVNLAPEIGDVSGAAGGLSDLASSMGLSMGSTILNDAITPEFYPQLMKSNNFILRLANCKVKTSDGKVSTDYFTYLQKYQKSNPLMAPVYAVKRIFRKKKRPLPPGHKLDPFKLTKEENDIFNAIRSKIKCSVDKKTSLITISVEDQDPLVAATMADQASEQLKEFISSYRTSKARKDLEYYKKITEQARQEYEESRRRYGSYSDAYTDVMLKSYKLVLEDMENDMQLKFNNYSEVNAQLQAARAKVQEKTPVFTSINTASVPLKPAGPKRMLFVASMLLITFLVTTFYISRDLIL